MEASRRSSETGLIRRWVEVLAFVGVWIATGKLLDMSTNAYLLFGIPLTAGFQLFVRKRPIKDLWVREGPGLSLRAVSLKLASLLAIAPFVHPIGGGLGPDALVGAESLLLYVPALFLMEEVAFRGAIDSHVRHLGERHVGGSTVYGIASAFVVSVLWGLWHYPVIPHTSVIQVLAQLLLLQVAVGPFLSLFWRRSGNLMVPGFVHATIDSIRNALGSVP